MKVPASGGSLQMTGAGSTGAGVNMLSAGTITGLSIAVDVADGSNNYTLEIRRGGAAIVTLTLNGVTSNRNSALSVAVLAGDILTAFLIRTSGVGASAFSEEHVVLEISLT